MISVCVHAYQIAHVAAQLGNGRKAFNAHSHDPCLIYACRSHGSALQDDKDAGHPASGGCMALSRVGTALTALLGAQLLFAGTCLTTDVPSLAGLPDSVSHYYCRIALATCLGPCPTDAAATACWSCVCNNHSRHCQVDFSSDGLPGQITTAHPKLLPDGRTLINITHSFPAGGIYVFKQVCTHGVVLHQP